MSGDRRAQAIPLALSQREQATARTVVWVATALSVKEPPDGNILAILLGFEFILNDDANESHDHRSATSRSDQGSLHARAVIARAKSHWRLGRRNT